MPPFRPVILPAMGGGQAPCIKCVLPVLLFPPGSGFLGVTMGTMMLRELPPPVPTCCKAILPLDVLLLPARPPAAYPFCCLSGDELLVALSSAKATDFDDLLTSV